jgi:hypothetical protein
MDEIRRRVRTPDAARYVGLAKRTLEKMRLTGDGPRFRCLRHPGPRRLAARASQALHVRSGAVLSLSARAVDAITGPGQSSLRRTSVKR